MNYYRVLSALVLMLGTINGFPAEQQETGAVKAQQPQESGAAVIEYKKPAKDGKGTEEASKDTAGSKPATGSSVELIVGGSAEDGVAKRKEMPVEK